jgi:hypothetical protein
VHGYDNEEENYIDYLKTKKFLLYDLTEILDQEHTIDFICYFNSLVQEIAESLYIRDINTFKSLDIVIYNNAYIFKEREFVSNINNGLNKFQNLWKKYYKQKMKHYKSIHNIRHRTLTGKFNKFKFIH